MKSQTADDSTPVRGLAARPGPSPVVSKWAWPAAASLILLVLLAPFLIVDVPAILDYPNHLARFYILAHANDPVLSRMYAAHWAPLPNIGMDLIGASLFRVLPVHVAGRVLLALSLVAPLAGTVLYARAAFGRWTWWSLGAGVLGFNGIFFLGFMNFLLGLGVALAGAAAWRLLRRRFGWAPTAIAGAAIALAVYFCHLLGFAFFALLIGAQETEALLALRRDNSMRWGRVVRTAVMLVITVGPALALYSLTRHGVPKDDLVFWRWSHKAVIWATPFLTYDLWLTLLTTAVLLLVGTEVRRRARCASGVGLTLTTLAILFAVAPFTAAGGAFLDARLSVMAAFVVFAGLDPQLPVRHARAIAAALIALGVGRSAEVAVNWRGRAQDLAELRAALAPVSPGSKVLLAMTEFRDWLREGRGRVLQGVCRLDEHLAGLVVIERRAFWPQLFADPNEQPVVVRPPYARMAEITFGEAPAWRDLAELPPSAVGRRYPYLTNWRQRFDYVLVLGPHPLADHAPGGISLVRAGTEASLYRIDHAAPTGAPPAA